MPQTGRRLTVYIPPDLALRLERVKDVVNPSRASQAGLDQAISAAERRLGLDERKARIVDRLLEAEAERNRTYQTGYAVGVQWAERTATWVELRRVAKVPDIHSADQVVYGDPPAATGGGLLNVAALVSLNPAPATAYIPASVPPPKPAFGPEQKVMYWVGFQRGVREVHNLVKDTMEAPPPPTPAVTKA